MSAIARCGVLAATLVALAACSHYTIPAEYDHPYRGELTVYTGPEAIWKACKKWLRGCALVYSPSRCTIVMNDPGDEENRRHEIAHCNGWLHP